MCSTTASNVPTLRASHTVRRWRRSRGRLSRWQSLRTLWRPSVTNCARMPWRWRSGVRPCAPCGVIARLGDVTQIPVPLLTCPLPSIRVRRWSIKQRALRLGRTPLPRRLALQLASPYLPKRPSLRIGNGLAASKPMCSPKSNAGRQSHGLRRPSGTPLPTASRQRAPRSHRFW